MLIYPYRTLCRFLAQSPLYVYIQVNNEDAKNTCILISNYYHHD